MFVSENGTITRVPAVMNFKQFFSFPVTSVTFVSVTIQDAHAFKSCGFIRLSEFLQSFPFSPTTTFVQVGVLQTICKKKKPLRLCFFFARQRNSINEENGVEAQVNIVPSFL